MRSHIRCDLIWLGLTNLTSAPLLMFCALNRTLAPHRHALLRRAAIRFCRHAPPFTLGISLLVRSTAKGKIIDPQVKIFGTWFNYDDPNIMGCRQLSDSSDDELGALL